MSVDNRELTKSLLAKLYMTLTGGDQPQAEKVSDSFIGWVAGGLPYQPSELRFASRGFQGEGANDAEKAQDRDLLYLQAQQFAELANKIPRPEGVWERIAPSIPDIYGNLLKFSEVAAYDLTPQQQEMLDRAQRLLTETKEEEDLLTGQKVTRLVDSRLVQAYKAKQAAYNAAVISYNSKLVNAQVSQDPAVVLDWAVNANLYRQQVNAALDDWVAAGYKNQVEELYARVNQLTERNLTVWKDELEKRLQRVITDPTTNTDFLWTSIIPAELAAATEWLNEFTFKESEYASYSHEKSNAWGSEAVTSFGLFSARASAGGSSAQRRYRVDVSGFDMEFWFAEVVISRPWFEPLFVESKAWRWAPSVQQKELSDGGTPPKGQMVAYPTRIIFAHDISVSFAELKNEDSKYTKALKAGGAVSFGPFSFGGSYSRSTGPQEMNRTLEDGQLRVEGTQIVGFRCHKLDKAPDPNPEIEKWV